ncbi:MAG: IS21-like element helper ATPase IstB [Saprospiraceae bacterium]|nr:ATP-binding protein [Candidatus Brachybacter algidus]
MNDQATLQLMRTLRLTGMADRFEALQTLPTHQQPSHDVLLPQLLESEDLYRNHRKTQTAIRNARFRYQASLSEIVCNTERNFSKDTLSTLSDCAFIDRGENIIITGATGCGKSYLASALGYQACMNGKKVLYFSLPKLLSKLRSDKIDGAFRKELERIENKQLLILDDWGLTPLDTAARLALLQIIEDRHNRYSTIITSQLPIKAWHQYINEDTIADAILDRIIHRAIRIDLKGESMRKNANIKP